LVIITVAYFVYCTNDALESVPGVTTINDPESSFDCVDNWTMIVGSWQTYTMILMAWENSVQFGTLGKDTAGVDTLAFYYAGAVLSFLLAPDATVTNTCSGFTGNPYNKISSP
jgi:hypothetical protein